MAVFIKVINRNLIHKLGKIVDIGVATVPGRGYQHFSICSM